DLRGGRRELWQLPLLRALGYHNLTDRPSLRVGARDVPIARAWQVNEQVLVPIHLVGACVPLDRRTEGATGAAAERPHALVQGYLNDEPRALWGIVTDGLTLRLLRDTTSLSRPPFLEFDVAGIFDGNDFAGFTLLWLVAHASRFAAPRPSDCALERWSQESARQGTRALDGLRAGVEKAIEILGRGFVSHPRNEELRAALRSGELPRDELLREVLRLVYRILFVAVAEERDVLLDPARSEQAARLYRCGYSLRRLLDLSEQVPGTDHSDLWLALSFLFERLHSRGAPELGLLPLGSFLFAPHSSPHLLAPGTHAASVTPGWRVELRNRDLLEALRAMARTVEPETGTVRAVDFATLGADELGSVYEGLLELHLDSASWPARFQLATSAGNERKTSGSYYTPDSLVQCLLDSALEPVIKEAAKGKKGADAAEAILNLKVCDPAVGSGHFLIAAAHRLAKHVARARAGDSEPTPDEHRTALREVIRRSVYGIDINPMSAELCRVALWMESMEPGRPLSFLESHIVVGNSLIGATPELIADGIP
ncbi:MAG: type II DNA modification enzyme, partial [Planctomycetes bacterium]|nr:type II DNA modification enzyme [Planctomycetota bacterium]